MAGVHCSALGPQINNSDIQNLNYRIDEMEKAMNNEKYIFSRFCVSYYSNKAHTDGEITNLVSTLNDVKSSCKFDKLQTDEKITDHTTNTNFKINDLNDRIDLLFKLLYACVIVILCCAYSLLNTTSKI